ncbi:hypothetical protein BGX28_003964 [Mortierella sp. GBA30]|nr:hypothetical protein BGX28_003964 [Mortierella sp. GBA30]
MPVFARITTDDPVEATSIASAVPDSSGRRSDAICTCPISDQDLMDGLILGHHTMVDYSPVLFHGHLATCAFHSNGHNNNNYAAKNTPGVTQLKLQAQQRYLQLQLQQQRKPRRDPFEAVRLLPTRTCHLFPGSRFTGTQCSGSHSYDVMVDIKMLFQPFKHIANLSRLEDTTFDYRDKDVVFMRWKEHFLVPDHRVEGITGASFAGFYYICYHKRTGLINGYYYHHSSEKFQQLILSHAEERSSFGSYEFR